MEKVWAHDIKGGKGRDVEGVETKSALPLKVVEGRLRFTKKCSKDED